MPDSSATIVLLPFLAAFVERIVEIISPVFTGLSNEAKKVAGLVLAAIAAAILTFALDLDLVSSLIGGLSDFQAKALTTIAIAGGSAPVHELIRLAEEAKNKAKQENKALVG
jgi:hypothetical protein